jgi:hypothetical protein
MLREKKKEIATIHTLHSIGKVLLYQLGLFSSGMFVEIITVLFQLFPPVPG